MSHDWAATTRYRLTPAPGALGLVQDFLNTVAIGDYGPDLLADGRIATAWAADAVPAWAAGRGLDVSAPVLTDAEAAQLRVLRDTIAKLVSGELTEGADPVSAALVLSGDGQVRLEPSGNGWRWLASALWGEILLSQHNDSWRRIKRCHNPQCASTFYDRSKNNSGVWHDVKTCGNAANLRASRARRRAQQRSAPGRIS